MKSPCCCPSVQPPGQKRMMKGSLLAESGGVEGGVVRGMRAEVAPSRRVRWARVKKASMAPPTECTEQVLAHPPFEPSLMH